MSKSQSYFSHDSNARNDEKVISVRMKYGMEGYGIYFGIIERLRECADYKCVKDYNIIAFDLRVDANKIKSVIEDFGLFVFTDDGKYFYSGSFIKRMEPLENLREQRRLAGLKSAEKRAKKKEESTTVERPLNEKATKKSKVKESKVKENIYMSEISEIPDDNPFLKISYEFWCLFRSITLEAKSKPTILDKAKILDWVNTTRLMLKNKELSEDELRKIYLWLKQRKSKSAKFWATNIKSMSGLREHAPQLLEQINSEPIPIPKHVQPPRENKKYILKKDFS